MPPCHLDLYITFIYIETAICQPLYCTALSKLVTLMKWGSDIVLTVLIKWICSEELVISWESQRQEIGDPGLKLEYMILNVMTAILTPLKIFQHKIIWTYIDRKRN